MCCDVMTNLHVLTYLFRIVDRNGDHVGKLTFSMENEPVFYLWIDFSTCFKENNSFFYSSDTEKASVCDTRGTRIEVELKQLLIVSRAESGRLAPFTRAGANVEAGRTEAHFSLAPLFPAGLQFSTSLLISSSPCFLLRVYVATKHTEPFKYHSFIFLHPNNLNWMCFMQETDRWGKKGLLEKITQFYWYLHSSGISLGRWRCWWGTVSVKVGLLHYPQKLLLAHLAVSVTIGLVDHLLEGDQSQMCADKNAPGCSWRGKSRSWPAAPRPSGFHPAPSPLSSGSWRRFFPCSRRRTAGTLSVFLLWSLFHSVTHDRWSITRRRGNQRSRIINCLKKNSLFHLRGISRLWFKLTLTILCVIMLRKSA